MRLAMMAAALACASGAAHAADKTAVPRQEKPEDSGWAYTLAFENDLFHFGQDRDYTNGLLASVATPKIALEGPWVTALPFFKHSANVSAVGDLSLTQSIYTPTDLTRVPPDPKDRPYAGVTLLNLGVVAASQHIDAHGDADHSRYEYLTYSLGVIGPDSDAALVQTKFHQHIGAIPPQGWRYQIPHEVIGGMRYRRTYVYSPIEDLPRGLTLYAEPDVDFALGNIKTEAGAGGIVRLGLFAPVDYGVPRIEPANPGSGYFQRTGFIGAYTFAGLHVRYVGYDATFDREPADNGPGVQKLNWVADAQAGFVLNVWRFRLGYTYERLSDEFKGQKGGHGFGAASLSVAFGGNNRYLH